MEFAGRRSGAALAFFPADTLVVHQCSTAVSSPDVPVNTRTPWCVGSGQVMIKPSWGLRGARADCSRASGGAPACGQPGCRDRPEAEPRPCGSTIALPEIATSSACRDRGLRIPDLRQRLRLPWPCGHGVDAPGGADPPQAVRYMLPGECVRHRIGRDLRRPHRGLRLGLQQLHAAWPTTLGSASCAIQDRIALACLSEASKDCSSRKMPNCCTGSSRKSRRTTSRLTTLRESWPQSLASWTSQGRPPWPLLSSQNYRSRSRSSLDTSIKNSAVGSDSEVPVSTARLQS